MWKCLRSWARFLPKFSDCELLRLLRCWKMFAWFQCNRETRASLPSIPAKWKRGERKLLVKMKWKSSQVKKKQQQPTHGMKLIGKLSPNSMFNVSKGRNSKFVSVDDFFVVDSPRWFGQNDTKIYTIFSKFDTNNNRRKIVDSLAMTFELLSRWYFLGLVELKFSTA